MYRLAVVIALAVMALCLPAHADYGQAMRDFRQMPAVERIVVQWALTWTGDYNRLVDGDFQRATYEAIRSFQRRNGFPQSGSLDPAQRRQLDREQNRLADRVGFAFVDDVNARMSVGVPLAVTSARSATRRGSHWEARDGSAALDSILVPQSDTSFDQLFERMKAPATRLVYSANVGELFVVSGYVGDRKFYTRIYRKPYGSRGISFSWDPATHPGFDAVSLALAASQFDLDDTKAAAGRPGVGDRFLVIASRTTEDEAIDVAQSYRPKFKSVFVARFANGRFAVVLGPLEGVDATAMRDKLKGAGLIPDDSFVSDGAKLVEVIWRGADAAEVTATPPSATPDSPVRPPKPDDGDSSQTSLGSGFFVSEEGYLLTNAHVAGDCKSITVPPYGPATLLRKDAVNDLAIIRLKEGKPKGIATFQDTPIRPGASVMVVGYPLSQFLGGAFNVTSGMVSSLSGLDGDTRYFQFTAPLQPGNSGGPVLDATGKVIGVATAKLSDLNTLKLAGSIPQNVNFALGTGAIQSFLRAAGVAAKTEAGGAELRQEDIADAGARFSAQVICEE